MTHDIDGYGVQIARLPRWLVVPRKRAGDEGSLVQWVGAAGVRVLTAAEHAERYAVSAGLFPRDGWGSIDWAQVDEARIVLRGDAEGSKFQQFLHRLADTAPSMVLIWQSTGFPSIELDSQLVIDHWDELVAAHDEFVAVSASEGLLIEWGLDELVRVARL